MSNPETINTSPDKRINPEEMELISAERREALRDTLEKAESNRNKATSKESVADIKQEAIDKATSSEESTPGERLPAQKRTGVITRRQRDKSFNKQMESIAPHLTKSEQAFSKVIHNKTVESTSDALGKTIARPNALLAGSVTAFIVVTIVYVVAKYYGYNLSGFETIAAFIIGWSLGLIYDYTRLLLGNKKN